jgi:hypothetical protein
MGGWLIAGWASPPLGGERVQRRLAAGLASDVGIRTGFKKTIGMLNDLAGSAHV